MRCQTRENLRPILTIEDRKMAPVAAGPLPAAAAEGLLCGAAEAGWKSDGKQQRGSLTVELFAQNCTGVGVPDRLQPTSGPAGFFSGGLSEGARWGPHGPFCRPAPGRTDQRELMSLRGILEDQVEAGTGARDRILDLCSFRCG